MIAVELHPEAGGARRYCEALQARGLLCKETHDHTIRIAPPLVITADQVDWIAGAVRGGAGRANPPGGAWRRQDETIPPLPVAKGREVHDRNRPHRRRLARHRTWPGGSAGRPGLGGHRTARSPSGETALKALAGEVGRQGRMWRRWTPPIWPRPKLCVIALKDQVFDLIVVNAGVGGPRDKNPRTVTNEEFTDLFVTNALAPVRFAELFAKQVTAPNRRASV